MKLILASASPRRKELLRYITEDFTVRVSHAEENVPAGLTPEETVKYLSALKANAVFSGDPLDSRVRCVLTLINGEIVHSEL